MQAKSRRLSTQGPPLLGMLGEVLDLSFGLGILLLPRLTIALPGVITMLLGPAGALLVAAAVAVVIAGLIVVPPFVVARFALPRVTSCRRGSS
jgi:hypothetical protein